MADERLGHEVFGSSSLVVRCPVIDTLVSLSERARGAIDRDAPHGACRKNMVGRLFALTSYGRSPEALSGGKAESAV
jgi:hypothetical protein